MKRFVFDNLIYRSNDHSFLLMNLISFRREIITKYMLDRLVLIESKLNSGKALSGEEQNILDFFHEKKQILPPEIVEEVDRQSEEKAALHLSKFPVKSITFNLTHACNFNCDYCYQKKYKNKPEYRQNMNVQDIVSIMEYLCLSYFGDTDLDEIVVSGGEPLLPANIDTINYICKHAVAKKKILYTNGINILAYKDQISFDAFDEVQVSLDGSDAVIKKINHYADSFDKIIGGIKYLQQMNKSIRIATIWTKELRSHLKEYIELLVKSNILDQPDTTLRFVLAKDYHTSGGIDEHFYDWDEIVADLETYNPLLGTINNYLELPVELRELEGYLHRPVNKRQSIKYKRCDITKTIPMICEPNGDIYWCLCLDGESGKIGNYKEKFFDKDKVEILGNRTIFKIEQCRQCKLRYLCGGGCILPLTSGDVEIYQPACGSFKNPFIWENLEKLI